MKDNVRIGLFGIGLNTYWGQFEGLLDRLEGYRLRIAERLGGMQAEIVDAGMVDDPTKAEAAADRLKANDVELVFLYISTYALSSTVLPVVQRLDVPVIILNLQPTAAIDYDTLNAMGDRGRMTGEWLAHCQACSVPEVACVFNRLGLRYEIVTGYLEDPTAWQEIEGWVEAARVAHALRHNRMGVLGHYYCGMLDVYTDLTRMAGAFGTHFELLEMCQLKALRDQVTKEEVAAKLEEFRTTFDVSPECEPQELERAALTSVALDKLVAQNDLGSMAYYYEGVNGNDYENIVTSVIAGNTLLTGRNIPVAGECEVKNAQAMKIMAEFGAGWNARSYANKEVLNPWNTSRTAGTCGGGAAVSARLTPAALVLDVGGNALSSASYCGVSCLKPTYGFISRHGTVSVCPSIEQLCIMARSCLDIALIAEKLLHGSKLDSTCVPSERYMELYKYMPVRLNLFKIGLASNWLEKADKQMRMAVLKAV